MMRIELDVESWADLQPGIGELVWSCRRRS